MVYLDLTITEAFSFDLNIQSPSCHDESSGAITVLVNGTGTDFQYAINQNPFQSFNAFLGLNGGSYTIVVQDEHQCFLSETVILEAPPLLTAETITSPETDHNANGTATVHPTGGTPPYTFVWNTNPQQSTPTASGLSAGTYSIRVIDDNGCIWEEMVEVDVMTTTQQIKAIEHFKLFPNPASDKVQVLIDLHTPSKNGYLEVFHSTGQTILSQPLDLIKSNNIPLDLSDFPTGIYWVSVVVDGHYHTQMLVKN